MGVQDGTESEGGGDGGCWQMRCEGVGQGEWRWQSRMGIDIDYILVVGHFGLATGSGGISQSNMHNESCPKPFTPS